MKFQDDYYYNNQNYLIINQLQKETFYEIYSVFSKNDNKCYTIERIKKNKEIIDINKIKESVKVISKIENDYILKLYDSFEDDDSYNIVMENLEYFGELNLRKIIEQHKENNKPIEFDLINYIINCICLGLKGIHKNHLILGNLRPENIFFTEDSKIKIGYFYYNELSDKNENKEKPSLISLSYTAPEIISKKKFENINEPMHLDNDIKELNDSNEFNIINTKNIEDDNNIINNNNVNYKYDTKADIWSLGCILYELCTLNYCFYDDDIKQLIKKIYQLDYNKLDKNVYKDIQQIISMLLNKNAIERPDIGILIEYLEKQYEKVEVTNLFEEDEEILNYKIEKEINNSINNIGNLIYKKEKKKSILKGAGATALLEVPIVILSGGTLLIPVIIAQCGIGIIFGVSSANVLLYNLEEKKKFIIDNKEVIVNIINNIKRKIADELYKIERKNKNIIIYKYDDFQSTIMKIKGRIISKNNIERIQDDYFQNFNIILVGRTNVGKSTLINEFLKLQDNEKAKESDGGPTSTEEFKSYSGIINNQKFTLFDTNGITNNGDNSIVRKKENITNEIKERIKISDYKQFIHCIWYCFQGSHVEESDKEFIKELLNIYTNHSIPIIFIHAQTNSKRQSETCRKGIKKYLLDIYNNDKEKEKKVDEQLNNCYIDILARDDEEKKAFGLDKLENITLNEITNRGLYSSYFESTKKKISDILINCAYNLIFTKENIQKLFDNSTKSLKDYYNTLLDFLNNLSLPNKLKVENKIVLNKSYIIFQNLKNQLNNELKRQLKFHKLSEDNYVFIRNMYDNKEADYKNKMKFKTFSEEIEKLIYSNTEKKAEEIINNIFNICFYEYIKDMIISEIKKDFKKIEESVLKEIFSRLKKI